MNNCRVVNRCQFVNFVFRVLKFFVSLKYPVLSFNLSAVFKINMCHFGIKNLTSYLILN